MTNLTDTRPALDVAALDRTDRLLLGGCAVVWLAALGAAVAATVALVDLSRGHTGGSGESGTPWVLYTIIGVSAAVIVAAVPLLLRARRAGTAPEATPVPPPVPTPTSAPPVRGVEAPTEKLRIQRPAEASGPLPRATQAPTVASPVSDRMYLRCTSSIASAMGAATLLISVATYLMAVDSDTAAWVLYGVAGVVTVGMCAIPWYFLRELHTDTDTDTDS
ncbi:DUF2561 family protein [Mycolicibacterium vaccae]|uniref:Transmembrane protein n=3 Tax=Mycolicibacterium vaccae TaxID=1810 RepID=K0VDN0_MYCVA|nr:DUF2561 family protein [Mycolicibacterium vaccae]ANI40639.1 hypothetical protein MYVA_3507 [Mycolicibacterium vaccae 95051]EJZ09209.1 hypothetical protein MVAC_13291 [Mycolicibacterium vaccae ATCC 25954]